MVFFMGGRLVSHYVGLECDLMGGSIKFLHEWEWSVTSSARSFVFLKGGSGFSFMGGNGVLVESSGIHKSESVVFIHGCGVYLWVELNVPTWVLVGCFFLDGKRCIFWIKVWCLFIGERERENCHL